MAVETMEEIAPLGSSLQFGVTIVRVGINGLGVASCGNGLTTRIAESGSVWIVSAAVG